MPSAVRIIEKYYLQFLYSVFQSIVGKTCCAKMKCNKHAQNYTFSVLNMSD